MAVDRDEGKRQLEPEARSEEAAAEIGFSDDVDWQAEWITSSEESSPPNASLYLFKEFELGEQAVVGARAFSSALGWYKLYVNGVNVTGNDLVPTYTPFDTVVEYQRYDVTEHLRPGRNRIGLVVGDGRFRGHLGYLDKRERFGDRLAGLMQLHVALADGSRTVVATDRTWRAGSGRSARSDPKRGERFDARQSAEDWLGDEAHLAGFGPVSIHDSPSRGLVGEAAPRVREVARLPAQKIWRAPSGKTLVDFGQNFAGIVDVRLDGAWGAKVTLSYSEVIGKDGELDKTYFHTGIKKGWYQKDEVTLAGGPLRYVPSFTIHGFRYVEIDGLEAGVQMRDIEAVVLSSDLQRTGRFECSHDGLNKLYENVYWSLRSNFVDTPTDCPTRERAGWTADVNIFAPTATLYVDAQAYLRSYLDNLAIEQFSDGRVPPFVPSDCSTFSGGVPFPIRYVSNSVGWGDTAVMLPWTLYQRYGDTEVLARQYESMVGWVEYLARRAAERRGRGRRFRPSIGPMEQYIMGSGYHWGEWLRPGSSMPGDFIKNTLFGNAGIATAYLAHSSRLLSQAATVLGKPSDADKYASLSDKVRRAYRMAFVHEDGRIASDRQDDYVRSVAFGLLTPRQEAAAVARLVELIRQADYHLGTGFLSTPMLLPVLAEHGHVDLAYKVLMQQTPPSWLYQVEQGATTIWESWEGEDARGNPRYSYNHYAFGSVTAFLVEYIVGIRPAAPGYGRTVIRPHPGGGLERAEATVGSPHGPISARWSRNDGELRLEASIPPGVKATLQHGERAVDVGPGVQQISFDAI